MESKRPFIILFFVLVMVGLIYLVASIDTNKTGVYKVDDQKVLKKNIENNEVESKKEVRKKNKKANKPSPTEHLRQLLKSKAFSIDYVGVTTAGKLEFDKIEVNDKATEITWQFPVLKLDNGWHKDQQRSVAKKIGNNLSEILTIVANSGVGSGKSLRLRCVLTYPKIANKWGDTEDTTKELLHLYYNAKTATTLYKKWKKGNSINIGKVADKISMNYQLPSSIGTPGWL